MWRVDNGLDLRRFGVMLKLVTQEDLRNSIHKLEFLSVSLRVSIAQDGLTVTSLALVDKMFSLSKAIKEQFKELYIPK